jgi:hypothetical protein
LDKLELKTFVNDELKQYGQMSEILYGVVRLPSPFRACLNDK